MRSCIFVFALFVLAAGNPRVPAKKAPIRGAGPPAPASSSSSQYIARYPSCATDFQARCGHADSRNNFQVLLCLQRDASVLAPECHRTLWEFKKNMTLDIRLDSTLQQSCANEIDTYCRGVVPGKGLLVGCLLDNKRKITNSHCHSMVLRMQTIVFSDYRFIRNFAIACKDDIVKLQCARIQSIEAKTIQANPDLEVKTQGATIACLEDRLKELSASCRKQVLKKEEAAGDDVHLDVALFQACQDVLGKFCAAFLNEPGKMYDCLFDHKFDPAVTSECKHHIRRRQKLEAADYKVDYSFTKACETEIKNHGCLNEVKDGDSEFGKTAKILICLNDAYNVKGAKISQDCMARGTEVKERLIGDYELNPKLVEACQDVVMKFCRDESANEKEGGVIDCLMDLRAETENAEDEDDVQTGKINQECSEELDKLIETADPESDFHIDHALRSACLMTITTKCATKGDEDSKVFSCLMEKMDDDDMPDECRKHLFHLQYFISRNFKLDHALYRACRDDALQLCGSQFTGEDGQERQGAQLPPQMILACLYRQEIEPPSGQPKITKACKDEVFRTLRERAISVKLNPTVERACMEEMVIFCPDILAENEADYVGVEFDCLQKNFNDLAPDGDCKAKMAQWTQLEAQDATLDRSLMKACKKAVQLYCKGLAGKTEGDLISCLKRHKNDQEVTSRCKRKLEDFQEVEEKDKRFDYKLQVACKEEGPKLCPRAKSRSEVLNCFAKHFRRPETRSTFSTSCKDTLKIALLEMNENIKHDSGFYSACRDDATRFCAGIEPGEGKIIECLRKAGTQGKLSEKCMELLEEKEEMEANDPEVDYALQRTCSTAIATVCKKVKPVDVLKCLIQNKPSLDDTICQRLITERQIEAGEDFRLDPHLREACLKDIPKFCRTVPVKGIEMIKCLKEAFDTHKAITPSCSKAVQFRERQVMDNPRLDAALYHACKDEEVLKECSEGGMNGDFLSCLKSFMTEKKKAKKLKDIVNAACVKELSRIMDEGIADIHNDPLLFQQCAMDLHKHCSDIPFGSGKKIICLLNIYAKDSKKLSPECASEVKSRVEMWDNAVEVQAPESLQDLVKAVATSKSRFSFLSLLSCIIVAVTVLGCFCGRKCRRRRRQRGKKL